MRQYILNIVNLYIEKLHINTDFHWKMRIRRAQTKEEPEVRVNFRREGFEVFKDRMRDRPFEDFDDFEIDE